jgi:hypothetical protein
MGLMIAAAFNGIFWYLLDRTFGGGLRANPWGDLILATIIAVISLAIVFWLIERANEETLRLAHRTIRDGIGFVPPAPMPIPVPASPTSEESAAVTDMPALAGNTATADMGDNDAPAATDSQEKA